jgi:hypothetical protein
VIHLFSKARVDTVVSATLTGLAVLFLASIAEAAPTEPSRVGAGIDIGRSKFAATAPAATSPIMNAVSGEQQLACDRPRRLLWIEGDGWVVRRVFVCH